MISEKTPTEDELVCTIALSQLKGLGNITLKKVLDKIGSATSLFDQHSDLQKEHPDISPNFWKCFSNTDEAFKRARRELEFIHENGIRYLHIFDEEYPERLRNCYDAPTVLYYKGNIPFHKKHCLSIVGTRDATPYGREVLNEWMPVLKQYDPLIVSGLAYGIDIAAHRAALENDLSTVAVLAHGLDRVYPNAHKQTALEMCTTGGLLTDYMSNTNPDRENFPKRNRIVAGLCQGLLVVETAAKGGSMITCELAISNNREVFAVPNSVKSPMSIGCHNLIRLNKAQLCDSPEHLINALGWGRAKKPQPVQKQIFRELNAEEDVIVQYLEKHGTTSFDSLLRGTALTLNQLSSTLLMLEMEGILTALSGKRYILS